MGDKWLFLGSAIAVAAFCAYLGFDSYNQSQVKIAQIKAETHCKETAK